MGNPGHMEIKEYAQERGVDLIGVASAEAFEVDRPEEPIVNPGAYHENAKSLVVYGFCFGGLPAGPLKSGTRRVRLSPGLSALPAMDQHCYDVIKEYLNQKGYSVARKEHGERMAIKPSAVKAGIGLYGKNSLVHAEEFGSCIYLGCVITDAPLEVEDRSHKLSDCGDCTLCMEACPTKALAEPYKLIRSSCITSWLDGAPVPREFRKKVGNRLTGCEICQEVCPKNRGLTPGRHYPVQIEETSDSPDLIPLLLGDESYYKAVLPSFALWLAGISSLRRNAALALGNTGDPAAVPALVEALSYPEPQLRSYAAWALGEIGGKKAREALARSLGSEVDLEVQEEIRAALQEYSR